MKKQSKFLSLILRHKPEEVGIKLDGSGWVVVKDLLDALKKYGRAMTKEQLDYIVENNDKKRFAYSEDGLRIRASQGHSIPVDLGYDEIVPPDFLYHGTGSGFLKEIYKKGLLKMKRQHVHLSEDIETAIRVGSRKGAPVILAISAKNMYRDGHRFYRSTNGVWLTDMVPAKYFISKMSS